MEMENTTRRVLIIYTGGTIGMQQGENGYTPVAGWMEEQLRSRYAFQDPYAPPRTTPPSKSGVRISYDIVEYDPLLDSANMETRHWVQIAQDIKKYYHEYDGFLVLHGTDTMVYTASALSFMLVNLRKTVVLTGSQIPLSELRNDAVNNLFGALTMAGLYEIPEVCLYFDNKLYRGNRCQKMDSSGLGAFSSSNLAPLAKVGVEIEVAWHLILQAPVRPLRLRLIKEQNVGAFRIFPGMSASLLRQFLQPPIRGVVLETYGAGNIPATRADVLASLQEAINRGVVIINCTQCAKGSVRSAYESGSVLAKIGVISGADLTIEAALTKLA
ncbi:MAG: L-asparaginase 1, partial [Deltaproteobacteria bacterium]|nr:L-asparaginase 1 [Deltaproteobacteria bacterium]